MTNKRKGRAAAVAAPPLRRVCILTGGGDAPGLNAVLRAFVRACVAKGVEVVGSEDGFDGLVRTDGGIKLLDLAAIRGVLPLGGSILGCSNRANPWAYPMKDARGREKLVDVSEHVISRLHDLAVDVLVVVGGDGSMIHAQKLAEHGVRVVGVPKTIDNDLAATDITFGFDTAVATATWAIDALHTTAHAHDRVMVVELMGRYAGWISLSAGIAGGADVVLIPEIPYDVERVVQKVRARSASGERFSIVVVGEGAKPHGGHTATVTRGKRGHLPRLGGAAYALAAELEGRVPHEIRTTVLGHLQRGGSPSAYDRVLATRFGVSAAELVLSGHSGRMVALRGQSIVSVPLDEVVGRSKLVPIDGELVRTARAIGIELGA